MDYKNKYIKYKNKYLELKKKLNKQKGSGENKRQKRIEEYYPEVNALEDINYNEFKTEYRDVDASKNNNIIEEDEDNELKTEFPDIYDQNRYIINSHGSTLTTFTKFFIPYINIKNTTIQIPIYIYFGSQNNCSFYSFNPEPKDLITQFDQVYDEFFVDIEERDININKNFTNRKMSGDLMDDILIQGPSKDEKRNMYLIYAHQDEFIEIYEINEFRFFSKMLDEIIINIYSKINITNIPNSFHIYCMFCLNNFEDKNTEKKLKDYFIAIRNTIKNIDFDDGLTVLKDSLKDPKSAKLYNQQKIIIDSHGCEPPEDFLNIRIPQINGSDVNIYFAVQCGFVNSAKDYGVHGYTLYLEPYDDFNVVDDTEDEEYINKAHTNMYTTGDVIKDYIITGEGVNFTSFIGYCHQDKGYTINKIKDDDIILFSSILENINGYICSNNIPGPYHIYCVFCLAKCDDDEDLKKLEELRQKQNKKSILYTTDKPSNSRDKSTSISIASSKSNTYTPSSSSNSNSIVSSNSNSIASSNSNSISIGMDVDNSTKLNQDTSTNASGKKRVRGRE
jgi:hypothetical protein